MNQTTKNQYECSGFIKVEDMQSEAASVLMERKAPLIYTYSTWITSLESWPIKQTLMLYADWAGVTITFDVETSGRWIFRRNKYFVKVRGEQHRVNAFVARYREFAEANS